MKTSKFFLSTLVAAAAMTSSVYAAQITNFNFESDTSGHLGSAAVSNISDGFTFAENVTLTIDNGWKFGIATLSGAWTGNGTFKAIDNTGTAQGQDFVLVGDMSGFSGNINIFQGYYKEDGGTAALGGENSTILQFGNENSYKATASTETINLFKDQSNVTVSTVAILRYNYSGAGSDGNSKLGINSSSISARYLEFKGGADYVVDSTVTGNNETASNNTLKISAGSVTFNDSVSNFGNLNVASGATLAVGESGALALGGTVSLSSAIQNSGTVTIAAGTVFDVSADTDTTYELVSGTGTIKLGETDIEWTDLTTESYREYFTFSGVEITSRDILSFATTGTVALTKGFLSLSWGSATSGTWNTTSSNTPWLNGEDESDFQNGDSVAFGTEGAQITVEGTVAPEAMAVNADTTLTGSGTVSVSAPSNITFSNNATLEITDSVVLNVGTLTAGSSMSSIIGKGTISLASQDKTFTLDSAFTGTLKIVGSDAANQVNLGACNLGGTTKIVLDGVYIWSGATKTFTQEVEVRGSYVGYRGDNVTSYMRNALRGPNAKFTFDKFVLAEGASFGIEEGAAIFNSLDGENGALYVSGGTVKISGTETNTLGTLNITGGTTTISGTGTNTIGTMYSKTGTIVIGTGEEKTVVSTTRLELGDNNGGESDFTINNSATLKVSGETSDWSGTGKYKTNSVVFGEWEHQTNANISGALLAEKAEVGMGDRGATITLSGTLAAKGIGQGVSTKANSGLFSLTLNNGGKLILGESGMANTKTSGTVTLNAGTIASYANTNFNRAMVLNNSETGTTFDTQKYKFADDGNSISRNEEDATGNTITVTGVLSGEGALIKTGAGTLTLSGANTYTGGTMISEGTLVAGYASALGAGDVVIESGAKLQVNTDVTLSGDLVLTVSDEDIGGTGFISISEGGSIAFAATEDPEEKLGLFIDISELTFSDVDSEIALKIVMDESEVDFAIDTDLICVGTWDENEEWETSTEWECFTFENGSLTLVAIPEPSAFGLLAGVGALALVAARRRRRK